MKLLVISQYFYPEQFGVNGICAKLAGLGHDVTVLTGLPNYPMGEIFDGYHWDELAGRNEEYKGVKVLRCRLSPRKKGKKSLMINYISFAYHASRLAAKLVKEMKSNGNAPFDRVLVTQYSPVTMAIPAILVKRKLKIPFILYCFDLWPESIVSAGLPNHGLIYFCILKLSQWIYRKADMILISSKNFRKYFNKKLNIRDKIKYLPIYAEDLFSAEAKDPSETTNLVFAGNVGEMQSMDTVIKAADRVRERPDIHFHIVGDGSALERSKQLAEELKLVNLTFHGRHPLEDMPKYYDMADAFLVTLKQDEFISYTLPGKVQSYMASGKPILAAINGEAADVIREADCGLCCPAEDDKGLADIILQFSDDKENRRRYGANAKSYYKANFSSESFFRALLEYLK
ncbi:MAG: glycosyltransferase family 4 protein [Eubacteriales bacterium]|nr:glycosyltransferase family 4 protein [Eubacteriales bacterium]